MPKLDGTHLPERLANRLADLQSGKEVSARDIKALLDDEQVNAMHTAWSDQQALRKSKRARNKDEELALGWKTKRDIYIQVYELALLQAKTNEQPAVEKRMQDAEVRQGRIYLEALGAALDAGKTNAQARALANNELTRNGMSRLDGAFVRSASKRDREVWNMEDALKAEIRKHMSAEELEQLEQLEEHEDTVAKRKRSKR
jgi:hypothetical protein